MFHCWASAALFAIRSRTVALERTSGSTMSWMGVVVGVVSLADVIEVRGDDDSSAAASSRPRHGGLTGKLRVERSDDTPEQPPQAPVQPRGSEALIDFRKVDAVDVLHEHRSEGRHEPRLPLGERIGDEHVEIVVAPTGDDILDLPKVRRPETGERVLELAEGVSRRRRKGRHRHVEEPEQIEELFGGERVGPTLELAQVALRHPEAPGELHLRQATSLAKLANFGADRAASGGGLFGHEYLNINILIWIQIF